MLRDKRIETEARHPYRSPAPPRDRASASTPRAVSQTSRIASLLLVVFAGLGVWAGVVAWHEHSVTRAIAALPRGVQEASYRRALEELSTTCSDQPALAEHCREQAELILHFPQCDDTCRQLARRHLPAAKR